MSTTRDAARDTAMRETITAIIEEARGAEHGQAVAEHCVGVLEGAAAMLAEFAGAAETENFLQNLGAVLVERAEEKRRASLN